MLYRVSVRQLYSVNLLIVHHFCSCLFVQSKERCAAAELCRAVLCRAVLCCAVLVIQAA